MVAQTIALCRSLLKIFAVYVAIRIVLTGILLMCAGYKVSEIFGNSVVFGGGGGSLMAIVAMCLCISLKPVKYKIRKIYIFLLLFSLFYYMTINALFIIGRREGYFLLTLYAGLKYEVIILIIAFILFFFSRNFRVEN